MNTISSLWDHCTRPPDTLPLVERRYAQLTAALLLTIMLLGVLLGILFEWFIIGSAFWGSQDFWLTAVSLLLLFVGYLFSRTPRYKIGAYLLVLATLVGIWSLALPVSRPQDRFFLVYMALPILLSSMLLSMRATVLLFFIEIITMYLMIGESVRIFLDEGWSGFLLNITLLVILGTWHRNQIEKDRQAELLDSFSRYRQLVELSPVAITLSVGNRLVYTNPVGLQLFGATSLDQVVGRDIAAFVHPDSLPLLQLRFRSISPSDLSPVEMQIVRLDGGVLDVEISGIQTTYQDHPAIQAVIHDVTLRKRSERALRQSDQKFRSIIEHSTDGIMLLDAQGIVIEWNKAQEQITGLKRAEIVGQNLADYQFRTLPPELQTPATRASLEQRMVDYLSRDAAHQYVLVENDVPLPNGQRRSVQSSLFPIPAEPTTFFGSITRDVSASKQAEDELRQLSLEVGLLYEAGQRLSETLDLEVIYPLLRALLKSVMDCDQLFVSSYNADEELIWCDCAWNGETRLDVSQFPPIPLEPEGHGTQSRVIRSGQALLMNDYQAHLRTAQKVYLVPEDGSLTEGALDNLPDEMPRSAIMAPLKLEERVIGVVQIFSLRENAYTDTHFRLFEALVHQFAISKTNAMLYHQAQAELDERKRIQAALREVQETFAIFMQRLPAVAFIKDDQSRLVWTNPMMQDLFGELASLGRPGQFPAGQVESMLAGDRKALAEGVYIDEVWRTDKNGVERCFMTHKFKIEREDGPPQIGGIAVEITGLRWTEQSLRRSEAHNRALLNAIPDIMFQFDSEGHFVDLRGSTQNLLYDPATFLNKSVYDIFPDSAATAMHCITQALATGEVQTQNYQLHLNDELRDFEARYVASSEGIVLVLIRDVTEAKRAADAYRTVVENSLQGIVIFQDSRIIFANSAFAGLLGRSVDEILAYGDEVRAALLTHEDWVQIEPYHHASAPHNIECRLVHKDGTPRWVLFSINQIDYLGKPAYQSFFVDITQRKEAELALQHSEAYNRAILDAIPDLMFRVSRAGIQIDVRAVGKEHLLVMPPDQMIGRPIREIVPPDVADAVQQAVEQVLTTQHMQLLEYCLTLPSGPHHFEARLVVNGPDEVLCIVRDITASKAAVLALQHSEARSRAILDAIPDLMFRMDRQGTYLDINATHKENLLVLPVEQLLGRTLFDVLPLDIAQVVQQAVQRALDSQQMQFLEYSLPLPSGTHHFEARIVVNGPDEVLSIVRDITQSKIAADELRQSQQMLRLVMDNVPLAIFWKDRNSVYLGANQLFLSATRYQSESELIGKNDFDYNVPDQAHRYRTDDQTVIQSGVALLNYEETRIDSHGAIRRLRSSKVPLLNSVGEVIGVLGLYEDITEKKQIEEALHRRDAILAVLAYSSEQLLTSPDPAAALPDILLRLGEAAQVSRAYIFENHLDVHDVLGTSLIYEWIADDRTVHVYNLAMHSFPYREGGAGRWLDHFLEHRPLYGLVRDFPPHERALLEPQGILSLITVPIYSGDYFWGFLGFDECTHEREWLNAEIEALRSVAGALGAAIARQRSEAAEHEQRVLAEALRDTSAVVSSTLNLPQVLELILTSLEGVVRYDAAAIMLVADGTARVGSSQGYADQSSGKPIGHLRQDVNASPCLQRIVRTKLPLVITDTQRHPLWEDIPETRWIRSHVGAPIIADSQVIGILNIDSVLPGYYSDRHAELLRAFADQAAVAIRNAQLYNEIQRYAAELEALRQATLDVTAQLDLNTLLHTLTASAFRLFNAEAGGVYLYRPEREVLEWVVRMGEATFPIGYELRRGEGLSGQVWEQNQPMIVPNYRAWEGRCTILDEVLSPEICVMGVPIQWQDQFLGVLNVSANQSTGRSFSENDVRLLSLLSNQAAIAIQNARLFAAEQEERAFSDALRSTAAALNSTLDLEEILDHMLTSIERVVPHDAANIMRIIDGKARIAGARGYEAYGTADWSRNQAFSIEDRSLVKQILDTGHPRIVTDTRQADYWTHYPETEWIRSNLAVAISVDGEIIGIINLDSERPNAFQPRDAERLQAFANQAASALKNARLFTAERAQRNLSDALRDTAAVINSSLDLDEVLRHILANIGRVVPHTAANIMILDQTENLYVAGAHGYEAYGTQDWTRSVRFHVADRALTAEVIKTGQPLLVPDTLLEPSWTSYPENRWIRSHVCAPIEIEGRVIGLLNLDSSQPNTFTVADMERLVAFVNQAGTALRNAQLYDELMHSLSELKMLYGAVSGLFALMPLSTDLSELGQYIAAAVVRDIKPVQCGVLLLEEDRLTCIGFAGGYDPLAPRDDSLIDQALQTKAARSDFHLVVPLTTASGVLGVLDLVGQAPFDSQDQRILSAFADRAAAAVENRRLYIEVRRYTDELEQRVVERTIDLSVRNAVAETLSSSLNVDQMLSGVLRITIEMLNVTGGAIYLLNMNVLDLVAHLGILPEKLLHLTALIHTSSTPISLINNFERTPDLASVLSVPIWRQGQVQGVFILVQDQPRTWRGDELRLLDIIGRQIGVSLANAQLYAEAVRGEAQIRTILQSITEGLLVFDQHANLILNNPAAEALFSFYPPDFGGFTEVARRLWVWLQPLMAEPREHIEFYLPSQSLIFGSPSIVDQCDQAECPINHTELGWPCWLTTDSSDYAVSQCAVYRRIPRRAIQLHASHIHDSSGAVLGTVLALHDVTYYRELDELKGRFVSTVSHELRTPLASIMLQVGTLLKYYQRFEEAERLDMLGDIQQQTHILHELIEDILELSRFDAKRSVLVFQWFNFSDLCQGVITSLDAMRQEKHQTLDTVGLTEPVQIRADSSRVQRVVSNLLTNAIKYTPNGGRITLTVQQQDGYLCLSIHDTGIGISADDLPHIFDRFFRADLASRTAPGTGLGLSITKEIVDLHQGRIDVHSVLGEGSTFTLYLPLNAER